HAWTNRHVGTRKSLVEAALGCRELDLRTATEVLDSTRSGILKNPNNSEYDRARKRLNRAANKKQHQAAARSKNDAIAGLQEQLLNIDANRKVLQEQLKAARGTKPRTKASAAESNSSGRVPSVRKNKQAVRGASDPYPTNAAQPEPPQSNMQVPVVGNMTQQVTSSVPALLPADEFSRSPLSGSMAPGNWSAGCSSNVWNGYDIPDLSFGIQGDPLNGTNFSNEVLFPPHEAPAYPYNQYLCGINNSGVKIILESTAITTVFVSPFPVAGLDFVCSSYPLNTFICAITLDDDELDSIKPVDVSIPSPSSLAG
ncbi:hypothetical protein V5O48_019034, partial [Marasmius crinis-equi]